MMILFSGPLKIVANILMILLYANDILAHAQIKDGLQRMSLPIVFILLLSCRLLIYYQELQRAKKELQERMEKEKQSDNDENTQPTAEEKKTQ